MELTLGSLHTNETGKIVRIEGGFGLQNKFRILGIRENKMVRMVARQPMRGPIVIEIDGRQITIGRGMANKAIVKI